MTPTEFLTTLWGDPPTGRVLLWTLPDKHSTWFSDFRNVDRFVEANKHKDIYTGVSIATDAASITSHQRIGNAQSGGIPGLWADIDIAGPEHQKENLPPNVLAAIDALEGIDYEPSIIVHSGHGLQCWWLFDRPWVFQDAYEWALAAELTRSWHSIVSQAFQKHGWSVDATHDLARVMRLPGTRNHKSKPVPVRVIETSDFRWRKIPCLPKASAPFVSPQNRHTGGLAVEVGELHLSEDLAPNEFGLQLLINEIPDFARTWNNQRHDFQDHDESPSVHDLSLASYAASAGWTDQEIAALIVAHRRKNGSDLKLRQDYYRRTITKARSR